MVLLEALACGIPVIGSKVDGSREALLDGQLGRLVDPNVPKELVKAIADVLCSGSSRQRSNLVKCFDVAHFRSRVAEWLMEQTAKDRSLRVSAQQPRSGET
jgi:phosphatidyl-myo-inositol dimannoside synthase